MAKTFTLPTDLLTETKALAGQEPCELLYQNQLVSFLAEEFEGVSYSPDQNVVDNVLAYSKAVEVKKSTTMLEGHKIIMN